MKTERGIVQARRLSGCTCIEAEPQRPNATAAGYRTLGINRVRRCQCTDEIALPSRYSRARILARWLQGEVAMLQSGARSRVQCQRQCANVSLVPYATNIPFEGDGPRLVLA